MDIPIIWGGIHPTICAEESIKIADMVCVGEGEESFLELCNRLDKRQGIENIKGIWVRKGDRIYRNSVSPYH